MKISVCGKGGSGKSTISVLLAKRLKKMGFHVLVMDTDESNFGVHRLLGFPLPENVLDRFGGKQSFNQKMNELRQQSQGNAIKIFDHKWNLHEIPEEYSLKGDGLQLLLVGKIHEFGEGGACHMGSLSKMILSNIQPGNREAVVVDTEAGTEHFGRGLEGECDVILGIVDPTYESFLLAEKILEMGKMADKPVWFLLNKVREELEESMRQHLDSQRVIGQIDQNEYIFLSSLKGESLEVELPEMDRVCRVLVDSVQAAG